jgi:hypothetical protein
MADFQKIYYESPVIVLITNRLINDAVSFAYVDWDGSLLKNDHGIEILKGAVIA